MTEQAHVSGAIPPLTLGWRIQMALDHGGLKHGDLVEKFEISRGTASRWCRDAGAPPKKFVLNEIAVMCGVSPRWLIDGKDDSQPDPEPPRGIEPLTYSLLVGRTRRFRHTITSARNVVPPSDPDRIAA
ncbi:Uncharacterised protein [Mycobacteroides abscessus]|uniref:hypothetical protein n=2 Tax=Mycobacteroides abscessus TaxID=36809 RepID=UPI0005E5844C|nr:hypothetical protein [Mycobacteroides abscessus]CPX85018.1 Uncharacterised protein [Mycobacteroides abscessus]CPZ26323.1 Uncharacterised protein [Mycobacteroides abscessus]CQA08006.1 Uncharacterised protein [Mycobacteroides abscessus]